MSYVVLEHTCAGCGGHLDDRVCRSCGCMHYVSEPTRHVRRSYPVWIPNYAGGCGVADEHLAATRREQEADRRRAAGE